MDDTCAVQVVIHMLDSRLEINVSRFLGTYHIHGHPFEYENSGSYNSYEMAKVWIEQ